jgi:hypothetical protein
MHPYAPYIILLLCPTPDDFTCQGESAATQGPMGQLKKFISNTANQQHGGLIQYVHILIAEWVKSILSSITNSKTAYI